VRTIMTEERKPIRCVAVVQCHVTHERCTGVSCATSFAKREHQFAGYGSEVEYYVPFTCGGCPGRRVSRLMSQLIRKLKKQGVGKDEIAVHLSTCIVFDSGHYPKCPHIDYMKKILMRKGLKVVEGSYVSNKASERRQANFYGYDR